MDLGTQVTIGLAVASYAVGTIVWAVRQEGRVTNHDALHSEHVKRGEEIRAEALRRAESIRIEALERDTDMRDTATARYVELRSDMAYFRQRIDQWSKHP